MKSLFIINPSSGKQNFLKTIESMIGSLIMDQTLNHVDVFYTEKANDAKNRAMSIKPGEYDFSGLLDVSDFLKKAQKHGLMAIVRPYVPSSVLKKGKNQLILFESAGLKSEASVEFVAKPDWG